MNVRNRVLPVTSVSRIKVVEVIESGISPVDYVIHDQEDDKIVVLSYTQTRINIMRQFKSSRIKFCVGFNNAVYLLPYHQT